MCAEKKKSYPLIHSIDDDESNNNTGMNKVYAGPVHTASKLNAKDETEINSVDSKTDYEPINDIIMPSVYAGPMYYKKREQFDESKTNPVNSFDPVVGWLICIDGPGRGQDYRLHEGKNYVGRNPKNDVCLQGDCTVSQENNCVIGYDNLSHLFYFADGTGRNMVYVNNKLVFGVLELKAYDVIRVGKTSLMFVPLCGERFNW